MALNYVYQYKDHLGSVRLSYADTNNNGSVTSAEIKEENNYYPFGLEHKGYNNIIQNSNSAASKFKFQGVEHEEALGLDLYEMDWRSYDPALGRFTTIDPLTEERNWLTPYNFVQNNPILRVDPSGLLDDYTFDKGSGKFTLVAVDTESETDRVVTVNDDGTTDKVLEDGITKGFIHPKRNYKTRINPFNVNGPSEPSLKEFEHFQEVMSRLTKVEITSLGVGNEIVNEDNEVIGQDIQAVILIDYEGNTDIKSHTHEVTKDDTTSIFKGGKVQTVNYLTNTHTHRFSSKTRPGKTVWDPSETDKDSAYIQKGLIQYIISGGVKKKFRVGY